MASVKRECSNFKTREHTKKWLKETESKRTMSESKNFCRVVQRRLRKSKTHISSKGKKN